MIDTRKTGALLCVALLASVGCQTAPEPTAPPAEPAQLVPSVAASGDGSTSILVGYFSMRGTTEKLANAVAEGAAGVEGVTVTKKAVRDVTKRDLDAADGIILGCPTHFANIPGEMKSTIDHWAWKMDVNFQNKVGGAFATGGNLTGGKEHVVISLLLYMLNNRMIIAGPIYKAGPRGYGEIGVSAATGADDPGVSDIELAGARRLGERVATVAQRYHR